MGDKKKIIVIDDVELNRAILGEAFSKEFEILEAEDGLEGLEKIKNNEEDLAAIFLDIIMPGMDGFTVLQELDKMEIMKRIPLFLITTETTDYVVNHAYNYGVVDVIQKPFNLMIIERRVRNIIELFETKNKLQKLLDEKK
ncbi:MAG: response regulator [Treponema sp.]|nr:response regulator [Treponema sp.]